MLNNKNLIKILEFLAPNDVGVQVDISILLDKLYPKPNSDEKLPELKNKIIKFLDSLKIDSYIKFNNEALTQVNEFSLSPPKWFDNVLFMASIEPMGLKYLKKERENNTLYAINQSIIATNKSVKASNEAIIATANRQLEILESQTNLYRNTLLLVGVNLLIGLGILITSFISYSDKKEIATLHVQLKDRDDALRTLLLKKTNALPDETSPAKNIEKKE